MPNNAMNGPRAHLTVRTGNFMWEQLQLIEGSACSTNPAMRIRLIGQGGQV